MKEESIKKANDLFNQILPIQKEIEKKSREYLLEVLKEHDGAINFDDYPVPESICVPYDGGNHPEYASNCFSIVYGVYLDDNDEIYLDTEDCSEYYLDDINWNDIYLVASYINEKILVDNSKEFYIQKIQDALAGYGEDLELDEEETADLQIYDGDDGDGEAHGVIYINQNGVGMDNEDFYLYTDLSLNELKMIADFIDTENPSILKILNNG